MSLFKFLKKHGGRLFQRMHLIGGIIWRRPKDFKAIPIVINNFNRLEFLKQLIASLESRGYHNIHIIDNNSTYPPLLKYYDRTGFPYVAKHLPWYVDSANLPEEEKYYIGHIRTSTYWTSLSDNANEARNPND